MVTWNSFASATKKRAHVRYVHKKSKISAIFWIITRNSILVIWSETSVEVEETRKRWKLFLIYWVLFVVVARRIHHCSICNRPQHIIHNGCDFAYIGVHILVLMTTFAKDYLKLFFLPIAKLVYVSPNILGARKGFWKLAIFFWLIGCFRKYMLSERI